MSDPIDDDGSATVTVGTALPAGPYTADVAFEWSRQMIATLSQSDQNIVMAQLRQTFGG